MHWEEAKPLLQQKLEPQHIKKAPRGKFGDYVEGYHVVSEANRIFGEDGWSYEITRLEKVSEQTVTLESRDGEYEQFRVGYLCTVKVYVNGESFKEGAAVGSGIGSPNAIADHHESAVKEAETDALKRALRTYGNTFGLALYDKSRENVGNNEPKFDPAAFYGRLIKSIKTARDMDALKGYWDEVKDAKGKLKDGQFVDLKDATNNRKAQLEGAPDGNGTNY